MEIGLPSGRRVAFPVESCAYSPLQGTAVVVKDAGDDPDVTHGAHLTATVRWRAEPGVALEGGEGVGVVTKPGLGIEVGEPAITATPRAMITSAVAEVTARGALVTISVPGGERMARKTTNARLGVLGGISILGTTGIVRPFSTASWRASVEQAVSVMAAQGERTVVLCTGGRTEKAAMALRPDLPEVCFVEVGDFTGAALRRATAAGLDKVIFVGMAGKLAKLAAGVLMTHYTRSKVDLGLLGEVTTAAGGPPEVADEVAAANTGRHAYEIWAREGLLRPGRGRAVPAGPVGTDPGGRRPAGRGRGPGRLRRADRGRRHPAGVGGPAMITVIGLDGSPLSRHAAEAVAGATLLVGGRRHLAVAAGPRGARPCLATGPDVVVIGPLRRRSTRSRRTTAMPWCWPLATPASSASSGRCANGGWTASCCPRPPASRWPSPGPGCPGTTRWWSARTAVNCVRRSTCAGLIPRWPC